MTTLKSLLENTTIDGKKARRKLRADAKDTKSPLHGHEHRSGWTFDAKQVAHVRKLLGIADAKSPKPRAKRKLVKKS